MLKQGLIKDTVNKSNFSEQCYFTFGNDPSRLQSSKNYKFTQKIYMTVQKFITYNSLDINGKPLNDSKGEITYASWFTDWFSEEAKRTYGKTIPSTTQGRRIATIKQPVGVCGIIEKSKRRLDY